MSDEPRPEPRPLRALIAGCGRIAGGFNEADERLALTHAAAYRRLGVPIAGCCDLDAARAQAFARRWGAERSGRRLEDVTPADGPLLLSVCVPPAAQSALLSSALALSALSAVLIEKPLGATLSEARAIAESARRWGRPVLVGYFRAFTPFYRELERLLREQARGALRHAVVTYSGTLESAACHALERLVALLGPPAAVHRHGGRSDAPLFSLEWDAGARARFVPLSQLAYAVFELDLFLERGRLRVVDSERRVEAFEARPDALFAGYATLAAAAPPAAAPGHEILDAVAAAVHAARTSQDDGSSLARAVEVARVVELASAGT